MRSRRLPPFAAICVAVALLQCGSDVADSKLPRARAGALDLGQWNFGEHQLLPLRGPWLFYSGRLATDGKQLTSVGQRMLIIPPGPKSDLVGQLQTLPHVWNRPFPFDANQPPNFGTYVLHLENLNPGANLKAGEELAVRLVRTNSALRLWALLKDGTIKSIGSAGVVGATATASRPAMRRTVGTFQGQDARALILEVCDHWTARGGPWEAPELGTTLAITRHEAASRSREYWVMGFLFLMGIYHIILFSIRRTLLSALFLGLCCIGIIVYAFVWGDFYQTDNPTSEVFGLFWSLRYATYFAMALTAIYYAMAILNSYPCRSWRLVVFGCGLFMIPAIFFASPLELTRYQLIIDLGVLLCAAYGLAVPFHALFTIREDRFITAALAGSASLISMAAASDILKTYAVHDAPRSFHYAASVWMLVQACIIAVRFERARAAAERVSVELRKVDLLKNEFLANTSHELRTPLNGITGIIESLLGGIAGPLDERMRSNLALVAASGRRLSGLVNDILDISRLNHGEIVLRPRPLDLAAVIRVVTEISRPLLGSSAVTLSQETDDVPPVYADEDRLQQILFNLVGNAIKFTRTGNITISAHPADTVRHGNGFVEVHVRDTGIGIAPDKQADIFQAFVQADGSIAREYGGTGLGLSITKHLIELHGGKLELKSALGVGSDFYFSLPAAREPPEDIRDARVTTASSGRHPESGSSSPAPRVRAAAPLISGGLQALIVDDDPINLQVLYNHLSLEGFHVTEARGGKEALECFADGQTFDIVLLDVMMPQISGYDVCRELRKNHSRSELPIIMLTAKNRVTDLVTGLECGANDYLAKPFDAQELRARVWVLVELKRGAKSQLDLAALQGELQVAWRIQQSLLPRVLPKVNGLEVAARYRAMAGVGGDFYTFTSSANHLGVLLTDVSGHGVPAALIVSMVHLAFSFQAENVSKPEALLSSMNRILYDRVGNEFITACYAYIDLSAGTLVSGNAGHPPILIRKKANGAIIAIRPPGRVLALMPEPVFETAGVSLESGDRILLYTDGALEAQDHAGEYFGDAGLQRVLSEKEHIPVEEFAEEFINLLVQWSGGPEHIGDDIAFVAIDVL